MNGKRMALALIVFAAGGLLLAVAPARTQDQAPPPAPKPRPEPGSKLKSGTKVEPKLVAVAETRLLMEGLAHANFRGLERLLKQKPADDKAWTFARGQALLIAETANLLMLRPPHNQGEPIWFARAMELRGAAAQLALSLSKRDYEAGRAGLIQLAGHCNSCHKNFSVNAQITVFDEKAGMP
jgi:hypothetical protein